MTFDNPHALLRGLHLDTQADAIRILDGDPKVRDKGGGDIVTEHDRLLEDAMRGILERHIPSIAHFGEEAVSADLCAVFDRVGQEPYISIIDPIDGTWAYAQGGSQVKNVACMAAIVKAGDDELMGEPVASIVHFPFRKFSIGCVRGHGVHAISGEAHNYRNVEMQLPPCSLSQTFSPDPLSVWAFSRDTIGDETERLNAGLNTAIESHPLYRSIKSGSYEQRSRIPTCAIPIGMLLKPLKKHGFINTGDRFPRIDSAVIGGGILYDNAAPVMIMEELGMTVLNADDQGLRPNFFTDNLVIAGNKATASGLLDLARPHMTRARHLWEYAEITGGCDSASPRSGANSVLAYTA